MIPAGIGQVISKGPRWLHCIAAGLLLLSGRYPWNSAASAGSWRGYLCSGFFLCIVIAVLSGTLSRTKMRTSVRTGILMASTLALTLPYRWLGLDRLYYYADKPVWTDWKNVSGAPPELVWFPQALWAPPLIPGEALFFFLLAAVLLFFWWFAGTRQTRLSRATLLVGVGITILVVGEAWLHISLRSPLTYICHFEQPPSANYWYHSYLFANGKGAVNSDYAAVWRSMEEVFIGTPHLLNGMMRRRIFPSYIASQFTYFVNPFYVMIVMNSFLWIAAAWALRDYVRAHFSPLAGDVAALLTASGPGFIMFVAQPQTYVWGYGAVPLLIWSHWRLCGKQRLSTIGDYVLLGGLLSLALLTYDVMALLVYLVGYELWVHKSVRKIGVSIAIALCVYVLWGLLTSHLSTILLDDRNSKYIGISLANSLRALRSGPASFGGYELYGHFLPTFLWNLGYATFLLPLWFALLGLVALKRVDQVGLAALLVLPSVTNFAVLYFGQTELATWPRFTFIGYVAVYALCGVFLAEAGTLAGRYWKFGAAAIVLVAIAAHVILTNMDVFAHPWLYYFFFYQSATASHF